MLFWKCFFTKGPGNVFEKENVSLPFLHLKFVESGGKHGCSLGESWQANLGRSTLPLSPNRRLLSNQFGLF